MINKEGLTLPHYLKKCTEYGNYSVCKPFKKDQIGMLSLYSTDYSQTLPRYITAICAAPYGIPDICGPTSDTHIIWISSRVILFHQLAFMLKNTHLIQMMCD